MAWERIAYEGAVPASWALSDRLIDDEIGGIMVPSFAHGADQHGFNIVFWDWQTKPPRQVAVNDAENRLPKDDRSWR